MYACQFGGAHGLFYVSAKQGKSKKPTLSTSVGFRLSPPPLRAGFSVLRIECAPSFFTTLLGKIRIKP